MKTFTIKDARAGAVTYRIEQLVKEGNTVINVVMICNDAVILYKHDNENWGNGKCIN